MIMIVYNEALDDEVMAALQGCTMKNYTKVMGVFGKGTASGTHMGDDIWPGRNNILYVACEEKDALQLISCVGAWRRFRQRRHQGLRCHGYDMTR
jgi:hypothetical protein